MAQLPVDFPLAIPENPPRPRPVAERLPSEPATTPRGWNWGEGFHTKNRRHKTARKADKKANKCSPWKSTKSTADEPTEHDEQERSVLLFLLCVLFFLRVSIKIARKAPRKCIKIHTWSKSS